MYNRCLFGKKYIVQFNQDPQWHFSRLNTSKNRSNLVNKTQIHFIVPAASAQPFREFQHCQPHTTRKWVGGPILKDFKVSLHSGFRNMLCSVVQRLCGNHWSAGPKSQVVAVCTSIIVNMLSLAIHHLKFCPSYHSGFNGWFVSDVWCWLLKSISNCQGWRRQFQETKTQQKQERRKQEKFVLWYRNSSSYKKRGKV